MLQRKRVNGVLGLLGRAKWEIECSTSICETVENEFERAKRKK
jgi:hypothetical protein